MAVTITSALLRVELGLADDADGNAKAAMLLAIAQALVEKGRERRCRGCSRRSE